MTIEEVFLLHAFPEKRVRIRALLLFIIQKTVTTYKIKVGLL